MGFIKNRVREMREAEKKGESVERELAPDPMKIQEDPDTENLMKEIVSDEEKGDIFEDRIEEVSKSEPEREDTTDVSLAEVFEKESPKPAKLEVETKPEVKFEDTAPKGTKSKEETPVDSGAKHKVKTVYGDEELTLDELMKGYMRTAHHTQVSQENAAMRKQLQTILSNPQTVVEYALANGVDLKALVKDDVTVPEFNIPEPDGYATDEVKANYTFNKQMWKMNQALLKEVTGIRNSSKLANLGLDNDKLEREFGENRGDVPETAAHAVYALYTAGVRRFGKDNYGIRGAIRDYKIAEGDVVGRWKASPQYKTWYETEKRKIIKEYVDGKENIKSDTLSPDSLPTGKHPIPSDKIEKPHSMAEARAAIKKRFFGGK